MKVAIVGSRSIKTVDMDMLISCIPSNCSEIVSGGADGMDSHAQAAAEKTHIALKVFTPDYDRFGRLAPLMRNIDIIEYSDMVLAFWDGQSRGTLQVITECIRRRIPVKLFEIKPRESGFETP